jgi:protein SCO1/2
VPRGFAPPTRTATLPPSDQKGKVALIFFGYTNCPDVCPTTLTQFKKIRAQLGKSADRVEFVLITVDPQRDTPDRLRDYLAGFDPTFIGLTGSLPDLRRHTRAFTICPGLATPHHTTRIRQTNGNLR